MTTENAQHDAQAFADDAAMIVETLRRATAAVEAGDADGLMAMFHDLPDTFLFDYYPPRTVSYQQLHDTLRGQLTNIDGKMTCEPLEIHPFVLSPDAAWSWAIMHVAATMNDGSSFEITYRVTDIWRRIDARWAAVHEHASLPVDPATGQADLQSTP